MLKYSRLTNLPKWRNGRRTGLKIPRGQLHEGSTPSFGTKILSRPIWFGFFSYKSDNFINKSACFLFSIEKHHQIC